MVQLWTSGHGGFSPDTANSGVPHLHIKDERTKASPLPAHFTGRGRPQSIRAHPAWTSTYLSSSLGHVACPQFREAKTTGLEG